MHQETSELWHPTRRPPYRRPSADLKFDRWVMVTSGLARITVRGDDSDGVYIQGGESGLLFAADTPDLSEGHYTSYPGITETIALLFPTKEGAVPAH
ncbi:hypothetical protein PG989_001055 [Apiospora arundinis]